MTGHTCVVCGNTKAKDSSASFHRLPKDPKRRTLWLEVLDIREEVIKESTRVCCRHFPDGDCQKDPSVSLGKRFASPKKKGPRAKRMKQRDERRELSRSVTPSVSLSSRSVTPTIAPQTHQVQTATIGSPLLSDYSVHELSTDDQTEPSCTTPQQLSSSDTQVINRALLARIELLEAQNAQLKAETQQQVRSHFRMEDIQDDDKLFRFYTGFVSFSIFLAFFEFLGPVVDKLNYWGSKEGERLRHRSRKLDTKNQLFLTLVKLRLNLKLTDLGFRFGISSSQASRYITTWICFLYHHLREINWIPAVNQVFGTQPPSFREKFPSTYAIIDGSEVFIQTPSDLHMQSSTWSQYKHHNTVKFLVACTPNGAVCFISPVYVGSISDVELTRASGFLTALKDKPGISIMADRGFTIKDMLKELNIDLNIPPFLEGHSQLTPEKIESGRKIASLRIHVERAIGRMKSFNILKGTIPISMARITNQIVCVCALLTNFQPALIPLQSEPEESQVESYFQQLESDCGSEDSECEASFSGD